MNVDDLLEAYLDALSADPDAPVPAGLDPQLAAFARTLNASYRDAGQMDPAVKQRIWTQSMGTAVRALTAPTPAPMNGRHHPDSEPDRRDPMIHPTLMKRPALVHPGLLTGTAALIVILIAGVLTLNSLGSNKPGGTNTIGLQAPTETATSTFTATSTLIPTSTLFPRLVEVSATPIPFQPTIAPPSLDDATPAALPFLMEGRLMPDKPHMTYKFTASEAGLVRVLAISKVFQPIINFSMVVAEGQGGGGSGGGSGGGGGSAVPNFVTIEQYFAVTAGMETAVMISGGEGDFTLSASFSRLGPIGYNDPLRISLSPDQTFAYKLFEGKAGEVISVEVGETSGVDLVLDLAESVQSLPMTAQISNPLQISDDDGGPGVDPEIYKVTLPRDGTYAVIVKLKDPTARCNLLLVVLRE